MQLFKTFTGIALRLRLSVLEAQLRRRNLVYTRSYCTRVFSTRWLAYGSYV